VLISLRNLEKTYPAGPAQNYVLRGITLDIAAGEFVSIMGPSGAGKSSLLHILGMHDAGWSGEYDFLDRPVHRMNAKQRAELHKQHIGFVFQSYHLLDNLTVYENLEIPLSYRNVARKERQSMVADTLDRFQIVAKKDLYPNQLSGGQQQLVGIARAVIANPQLLLADEPTGNLHSEQGKEIMELFRKLNADGTTIVQVTHSDVNASYGSRIVHLRDGWLGAGDQGSGMGKQSDVWQGTLALMILKTLETMGAQHGYGIARRIEQTSGNKLLVNYGTLYPALLKLEQEGYVASEWGVSDNNRRAKYYKLTRAGKKQVERAAREWEQTTEILARFLTPDEA